MKPLKRKTTKEILAESFRELAAEKRIDKITITEITNNCGMSQPTFYNHFKDKYDLIVWIYLHESDKIISKIGKDGYTWKNSLFDWAQYFAEKREYFVNALKHTGGQDSFIQYVRKINSEIVLTEVRKKLMTEYIPEEIYGMVRIYVYGSVQYMLEWLMNDRDMSPETVAEIWEHSLPEPLKQYLYD